MRQSALALIFNGSGEFLLVRQAYGPRWWSAPGGTVEAEETPQEAVIREVREELGVEVKVEYLTGLYDVDWGNLGFGKNVVYVFACQVVGELCIN